jgi:hypothetical protein
MWKLNANELSALIEEFEDIEARRSASGVLEDLRDAARSEQVERRLMKLLGLELADRQRRRYQRLSCDFWIEARSARDAAPGAIVDIGVGGVFVATQLTAAIGESVELEMERQPGAMAHGLIASGVVAWTGDQRGRRDGFGLCFAPRDEAARAATSRFVFEILRKRLAMVE